MSNNSEARRAQSARHTCLPDTARRRNLLGVPGRRAIDRPVELQSVLRADGGDVHVVSPQPRKERSQRIACSCEQTPGSGRTISILSRLATLSCSSVLPDRDCGAARPDRSLLRLRTEKSALIKSAADPRIAQPRNHWPQRELYGLEHARGEVRMNAASTSQTPLLMARRHGPATAARLHNGSSLVAGRHIVTDRRSGRGLSVLVRAESAMTGTGQPHGLG